MFFSSYIYFWDTRIFKTIRKKNQLSGLCGCSATSIARQSFIRSFGSAHRSPRVFCRIHQAKRRATQPRFRWRCASTTGLTQKLCSLRSTRARRCSISRGCDPAPAPRGTQTHTKSRFLSLSLDYSWGTQSPDTGRILIRVSHRISVLMTVNKSHSHHKKRLGV